MCFWYEEPDYEYDDKYAEDTTSYEQVADDKIDFYKEQIDVLNKKILDLVQRLRILIN